MIVLKILVSIGVFVTFCFWLMAIVLLPRMRKRQSEGFIPSVTLFKPICGADAELAENLRSFCRQDYPKLCVIFGIADERDPALPIVRQIREEFPDADIAIVTGAPRLGANAKVANLAYMASLARGVKLATESDAWAASSDGATIVRPVSKKILARAEEAKSKKLGAAEELWVVSDSDVRVTPDWLRQVVTSFVDERVGLVSCFYRVREPRGLSAALEAFQVNVDFLAGVLVAEGLLGMSVALGATMAVRRSALEKIGGFAALAEYLADDFQLGRKIIEAGYRVETVNCFVDLVLPPMRWGVMWAHQVRWARTYRVCQPAGFFFSILSNALLWGLLAFPLNPLALVVLLVLRLISAFVLDWRLTARKGVWKYLWLAPLRDAMNMVLWVAAWGNRVCWGGRTFRLSRDGKMTEITNAKR